MTVQGASSRDATYSLFAVSLWTCVTPSLHVITYAHTSDSEAEITTAIICSSLPALAALYRHYVPEIRSKLSFSRHTGGLSTSNTASSFAFHGPKLVNSQCFDAEDPQLLHGQYLELGTVTERERIGGYPNGLTTRVRGGVQPDQCGVNESLKNDIMVGEDRPTETRIKKTVSVEQTAYFKT